MQDDDKKIKKYLEAIRWMQENRDKLDVVYLGLLDRIEGVLGKDDVKNKKE